MFSHTGCKIKVSRVIPRDEYRKIIPNSKMNMTAYVTEDMGTSGPTQWKTGDINNEFHYCYFM
jgi:hypothetical protein